MEKFLFWQRWLFTVSIIISACGALMALLSGTMLFDLFNQYINPVFWGANPVENNAKEFQQFVYGVLGATLTGWGIFMIFIVRYPFRNQEKWAWNCMLLGILGWFLLDTPISIYYKVYINAISNAVLLLLTMVPIIQTRKYFTHI